MKVQKRFKTAGWSSKTCFGDQKASTLRYALEDWTCKSAALRCVFEGQGDKYLTLRNVSGGRRCNICILPQVCVFEGQRCQIFILRGVFDGLEGKIVILHRFCEKTIAGIPFEETMETTRDRNGTESNYGRTRGLPGLGFAQPGGIQG